MFGNAYQNGATVEVWDAKVNVDKNQFYKQLFRLVPSSACRYFDKDVKSYLYHLQGQNARLTLPADDTKLLALHQRFLVLHIMVPVGFAWGVELTLSDIAGIKRRINITTTQGKQEVKYFSFRYPVDNLKKGGWVFLAVDVFSFMQVFKEQTFRSLDQITLTGPCKLRRIFTMKEFVEYEIPKNYWLSQSIPQEFQLIQFEPSPTTSSNKLPAYSSKQLNDSPPRSPHRIENVSGSPKQEVSPKINKSQIETRKLPQGRKNNLIKSEVIIENARNRIDDLKKQEEKLIKMTKELEASPSFKHREKHVFKIQQERQKVKPALIKSKILDKYDRPPESKATIKNEKSYGKGSKLPQIERSFKEDSALNIQYEQSSNFTEQHMKATPTPPANQEAIEEDRWSEEERAPSRPIPEAITNFTANFPSTLITRQNNNEVVLTHAQKKELELIYDEMVGCYYHPETNSYYELRH